ncbi:Type 2 DNA topoisomerase 6 subunit B-like [Manis javanica]|nr:Type 2 DNA topoisomerase 6 subunit B-like [Manis javanica]
MDARPTRTRPSGLRRSPELQEMEQQIEKARAEVTAASPALSHAGRLVPRDPSGVLYAEGTRYGVELSWNRNGFELRDRILKAINEPGQEAQQKPCAARCAKPPPPPEAAPVRPPAQASWPTPARGARRLEGRRLLEVGRGSLAQVLDAQLDMQRLLLDEADAIYATSASTNCAWHVDHAASSPPGPPDHWLNALFTLQTDSGSGGARHCPHGRAGTRPALRPRAAAPNPGRRGPCPPAPCSQRSAAPWQQLRPVSDGFSNHRLATAVVK